MSGTTSPQELVERALALSRTDGCLVVADETSSANLRWANNTLTTNGVTRGRQLTVVATVDGAQGTACGVVSRAAVTNGEVEELVRAAERAAAEAATNAAADDARPLVTSELANTGTDWDAEVEPTSARAFAELAPALGAAFGRATAADRLLFGFAEHEMTSSFLGTSSGLRLRHDQPSGKVELTAKSTDYTRSAWVGAASTTGDGFAGVDVTELDGELATRLEWARRQVALEAGRYQTLLPPSAVADLMIYLYWSAGARNAHEGRSVFGKAGGSTRVGERLSPLPVTLYSDPRLPGMPGMHCAPFALNRVSSEDGSVFDNGLGLSRTDWVREGVLANLVQTRETAELTGLPVTPAVGNLAMSVPDATASLADMVAATERGLLLTCLWYIREVDPETLLLTGLTRDGVYLVENGEVTGAVNNFRFNESPVSLLGRLAEVGRTEQTLAREWSDYFTRSAMPPVRVADFNMSSVSQAS